jgi:hypothetical protein
MISNQEICLGLVLFVEYGQLARTIPQLRQEEDLDIGAPTDHRIPACIVVPQGQDRAFVTHLESLPGIMKVDVAYAEILDERSHA